MAERLFAEFGMRPVINARGIYTDLGGWRPSPRVWGAMQAANQHYADMADLLERSGGIVAELLGVPAARITPGATAGIVLATAACMTGTERSRIEQLPDTRGMADQVVIQRAQRYRWDKFVTLTGARLVEVGDADGTTAGQLETALGPRTAAVLHVGHLDGIGDSLPLLHVAELAHARGIPVIVDAAYSNYPTERFRSFLDAGADLAIFSAKYFGGPNTGGFVIGRADLVAAVAANDFSKAGVQDTFAIGRPFKLDRQLVVGVVEALREWLELDHGGRFEGYERHVQRIAGRLGGIEGLTLTPMCFTMEEELQPEPINCLVVRVAPTSGLNAAQVEAQLRAGNPAIYVHVRGDDLIVDVECVDDWEVEIITERLARLLQPGAASQ